MNTARKTGIVMIASLVTMSLFSFKNAGTNEASFKNANVTTYATQADSRGTQQVAFTGAIVRTAVKVWQKSSKLVVTAATSYTDFSGGARENVAKTNAVKSRTLLAKL